VANLNLPPSKGQIVYPQKPQGAASFQFNITPGSKGSETMDFTPSGVVVTNPYNYYIYFPGANQWVAPRAYNFIFGYAPVPANITWDTTKDPLGNAQVENPALIANGIATNDVSQYSGGSTAPVPPTSVFTGTFALSSGITKGDYYGFAFTDLADNIMDISPAESIYSVTILFQVLMAGWANSAQNLWMTFRVGFASGNTYSTLTLAAGGFVETAPSSGDSVTAYSSVTYSPASPIPVSSLLTGGAAVQGMYVVMDNVVSNYTLPGIAFAIAASVVAG
jgi:hypothetical protein